MRIGNNVINGIFQLKENIDYTINDIILYNGLMYHVDQDFIYQSTSDLNKYCTPYSEYICYNESTNPTGPIDQSTLRNILNSWIGGIESDCLKNLTIDNVNDHNEDSLDYSTTQLAHVHYLEGSPTSILVPNTNYILRVYKINSSDYVQEWLDYINSRLIIRSYLSGSWNQSASIGNNSVNEFFKNISDRLQKCQLIIKSLKNSANCLYKVNAVIDSEGKAQFTTDSTPLPFIQVNIVNKNQIQSILIDTSFGGEITSIEYVSGSEIKVSQLNNNVTVSIMNNSDWKISSIISSKPIISK